MVVKDMEFMKWLKPKDIDIESKTMDQAVILNIDLNSLSAFGAKEQQRGIVDLEADLKKVIGQNGEVDGHEFGDGIATIYIYSADADETWETIRDPLRKSDFDTIEVTIRKGPPNDSRVKERHFSM